MERNEERKMSGWGRARKAITVQKRLRAKTAILSETTLRQPPTAINWSLVDLELLEVGCEPSAVERDSCSSVIRNTGMHGLPFRSQLASLTCGGGPEMGRVGTRRGHPCRGRGRAAQDRALRMAVGGWRLIAGSWQLTGGGWLIGGWRLIESIW